MKKRNTKLVLIGIFVLLLMLLFANLPEPFSTIAVWICLILGIALIYFGVTGKHEVIANNVVDSVEESKNASIRTIKKISNRKECDEQLDDFIASCGGEGRLRITKSDIYFIKKDSKKEIPFDAPKRGFVPSEEYADHVARRLGWDIKKHTALVDGYSGSIHVSSLADEIGAAIPSGGASGGGVSSEYSYAILTPKALLKEEKQEKRKQWHDASINYKGV